MHNEIDIDNYQLVNTEKVIVNKNNTQIVMFNFTGLNFADGTRLDTYDMENPSVATSTKGVVDAKTQGVRIGMTQQEVLDSSWGRPKSVNTSTTQNGTHEQWVYGGKNYLYFDNGILTTIQN